MALKKKINKTKSTTTVTFELSSEAVHSAEKVWLVGDFNSWSSVDTPMQKEKTGGFSVTLELESGKEYQFRYLIDGKKWENDWAADKYIQTPYGNSENSVVVV